MRMLDAFHDAGRPRQRAASGWFALGGLALLCLGAALPLAPAALQGGTALAEFQSTSGTRDAAVLTLVEGTLARLKFSNQLSVTQTAAQIANPEVATIDSVKDAVDEVVLRALKVGRTNLLVRFKDGAPEAFEIVVKRDLSVLESALKAVHPSISVAAAADRNALILTGLVPDGATSTRAQQAVNDYAQAMGAEGKVINLIRVQTAVSALDQALTAQAGRMGAPGVTVTRVQKGQTADDKEDVFVVSGSAPDARVLDDVLDLVRAAISDETGRRSRIVSQVQVTDRPSSIESIIERGVHEQLGHTKVRVARIVGADALGDTDVLVMTGTVPTQIALTQTLTLAAKVFHQQALVKRKRDGEFERITETFAGGLTRTLDKPLTLDDVAEDIRVAADESGALRGARLSGGDSGQGGLMGQGLRTVLSTPGGGFGGGGSTGLGRLLENRIEQNLARATAIELAEGRILSFIEVQDIPQVRIAIRLFEIGRSDLLNWDSNINKIGVADFDTNGINPNTPLFGANDSIVTNANGDPILFASNTDVANVISFLEAGFANQVQVGGEHFNLDAVFRVLETEGVARTLASPTLTVLSGEIAAFGDGGSVSVTSSVSTSVGINDGSTGVFESVQQLPFGIQLAVRPLVGADDYITMDVAPSVSNPDFELTALVRTTTGTPQETVAFAEKNLRTSARVRDGEVLLIGGLQDRSRKDESGKTPWLSEIPILGWLFHDKKLEDKDREIMIAVNPTIVRDRPARARLWAYPSARELLGREPAQAAQPGGGAHEHAPAEPARQ